MVPSRQGGAEAPRPTGGSPWPSIVHASGSAATREPRRYARRRRGTASRGLVHVRGKRLRRDGRVDGRLPAAVPRRVRGRPRGIRAPRGTTGDAGGRCAARPGRGIPERAGGLREPDRATGDLACIREAARQRAGATLCRHGIS